MTYFPSHVETKYNFIMARTRHNNENGYYTTIATKISLADKVRLSRIADSFGMTFYNMLQGLLLLICRMADKGSAVTYEHQIMLQAFLDMTNQEQDSFSPLAIKGHEDLHVCNAILFIQQKPDQRPQLMEIHKTEHGSMMESYNHDTMLTAFLNCIDPLGVQRLEDEAKRLGYSSISQTLHKIIMERTAHSGDTICEDVNDLFSDVRIPTGQKINDNTFYKQKQNRGDYTTITPRKKHYRADL